jgi:hypothetical protein
MAAVFICYLRKLILTRHGHPFDLFDADLKDGQRLRKIAEKEQNHNVKLFYNAVNWGFRLLFLLGLTILLITRVGR